MEDQIEVVPLTDGTWECRERVGGEIVDTTAHETRKEAIAAGRAMSGAQDVDLTLPDGTSAGRARIGGGSRVVLLRLDGSLYGELDPPKSSGSAQLVTLSPAGSSTEAVSIGG